MAFELRIEKLERDEVTGKDVLRVEGVKTKDDKPFKTIVFVNKYNTEHIEALEEIGVDGLALITMEKRDSNGKTYWNISKVEAVAEGGDAPEEKPKKESAPKAAPKDAPKTPAKEVKITAADPRCDALNAAVEILKVAAQNGSLPKKQTGPLLAQSAIQIAVILEGYLSGTAKPTESTTSSLSGKATATPAAPLEEPVEIPDDDIPF